MTSNSNNKKTKKKSQKTKKPRKRRLVGIKRKIYLDLKEELELNDNYNAFTEDLIQDYLVMYETKQQLHQDIIKRGVTIDYDNGGGQKGSKGNPSIDLLNRTNAQMLKILAALGLKQKSGKPSNNSDGDDDLDGF